MNWQQRFVEQNPIIWGAIKYIINRIGFILMVWGSLIILEALGLINVGGISWLINCR